MARKFNVALEAIVLQTRHIIDEMNKCGHEIKEIYMSGKDVLVFILGFERSSPGGQSRNLRLMQLLADACSLPVIIPSSASNGTTVVLGSAILGRCAFEQHGKALLSEERLWQIMV